MGKMNFNFPRFFNQNIFIGLIHILKRTIPHYSKNTIFHTKKNTYILLYNFFPKKSSNFFPVVFTCGFGEKSSATCFIRLLFPLISADLRRIIFSAGRFRISKNFSKRKAQHIYEQKIRKIFIGSRDRSRRVSDSSFVLFLRRASVQYKRSRRAV